MFTQSLCASGKTENMKPGITVLILIVCIVLSCESENPQDLPSFNFDGVTFANGDASNLDDYILDSVIISYDEIIGYDSAKHKFLVEDEVGIRMRSIIHPSIPTPFAIAVDKEVIYIAYFIPAYSSSSRNVCFMVDPFTFNNEYRIELGYHIPDNQICEDSRNDIRIIERLKENNKLIEIE